MSDLPKMKDLMWPIYTLLKSNDQSSLNRGDLYSGLLSMGFKDKFNKSKDRGKTSILKTRMGFALTYLKMGDSVVTNENCGRGVWKLTESAKKEKIDEKYLREHYDKSALEKQIRRKKEKEEQIKLEKEEAEFDRIMPGLSPVSDKPKPEVAARTNAQFISELVEKGIMEKSQAYDALVCLG